MIRKADAVKALLDHQLRLESLGLQDVKNVLEAFGHLDAVKMQLVQDWLEDLTEALEKLEEVLALHSPTVWKQIELLKMRLPEAAKVKQLRERVLQVWKKERPGVLK